MTSIPIPKKLKRILIFLAGLILAGSPAFGITLSHDIYLNGDMYHNLAMGAGGTVYVPVKSDVDYSNFYDKFRLYAINPDGTQRWVTDLTAHVFQDPAVGPDGTIYMVSKDKELVAINHIQGAIRWRLSIQGNVNNKNLSPAVGSDGTVYFGTNNTDSTDNGFLYAVNPDQTIKWTHPFDTGTGAKCTPVIAADGTVYVVADYLYAFWPDGSVKWSSAAPVGVDTMGMAIAADGTIYVQAGFVRAYNPGDGSLKWTATTGYTTPNRQPCGEMAIGNNGAIYVGSDDHKLYALDPDDGSLDWSYTTGGKVYSGPVVTAAGDIIFGSTDDKLYCLSPSGAIMRWTYDTGGDSFWAPSPVITDNGTLYAVTWYEVLILDGSMHNLSPSSTSPWPRFRGNNRNSANQMGFSPALVSPVNNEMLPTVTNGVVNFDWNKISYAPGYQFQLSPDPAFSQVATGTTTDTDLDVASSIFTDGYQYFWRVTSTGASPNGGGTPVMSASQSFIYGTTLKRAHSL